MGFTHSLRDMPWKELKDPVAALSDLAGILPARGMTAAMKFPTSQEWFKLYPMAGTPQRRQWLASLGRPQEWPLKTEKRQSPEISSLFLYSSGSSFWKQRSVNVLKVLRWCWGMRQAMVISENRMEMGYKTIASRKSWELGMRLRPLTNDPKHPTNLHSCKHPRFSDGKSWQWG